MSGKTKSKKTPVGSLSYDASNTIRHESTSDGSAATNTRERTKAWTGVMGGGVEAKYVTLDIRYASKAVNRYQARNGTGKKKERQGVEAGHGRQKERTDGSQVLRGRKKRYRFGS